MKKIGLTGGIGSGKSTVARMLSDHNIPIIDADRIARSIVEPGTPALAELVDAFGSDILHPDGSLRRAELARRSIPSPTPASRRKPAANSPRLRPPGSPASSTTCPSSLTMGCTPAWIS